MVASRIEELSAALVKLAKPGMSHKQLIEAVRQEHPNASKKEIVRAAFYSLITSADADVIKASQLQEFALVERVGPDSNGIAGT